jgi:hypothetical protein
MRGHGSLFSNPYGTLLKGNRKLINASGKKRYVEKLAALMAERRETQRP